MDLENPYQKPTSDIAVDLQTSPSRLRRNAWLAYIALYLLLLILGVVKILKTGQLSPIQIPLILADVIALIAACHYAFNAPPSQVWRYVYAVCLVFLCVKLAWFCYLIWEIAGIMFLTGRLEMVLQTVYMGASVIFTAPMLFVLYIRGFTDRPK
ncbi:hypothetical protein [Hahella sp. HN01]|uniref:hypothetical protein n=1 Tax=Hahella sp. HN01 TaxID=2847262 RepID=UPI001C1EF8CF|nr:hypothetical protein [Hahella sp. HN01]MBU6953380.1 hypothetical protein [Hahella sp. HN01]